MPRTCSHAGAVGPVPLEAALFVVGWVLMIVAMMLPSSVPLVMTFGALVGRRRRPGRLVVLLLLGYLVVWGAFGLAAWVADRGIHAAVDALPWLAEHPQLIIGTTLLVAGLWQFSPLRERCLEACRSPLGFVVNRWRGTAGTRESFAMGIAHGAFCVGCCWSLMLVMFGVGLGSLPAMLVLGGLTAIEKNLPSGRRLTRPLGVRPHPGRRLRGRFVSRGTYARHVEETSRRRPQTEPSAATRRRARRARASSRPPARRLLADGYANLSTRRVADAAGVPLSQIHYHFGSKQQLILAVLEAENARLLERQRAMFGGPEPLWQQWERACDFFDEDLALRLRPGPPGDDRRRLVRPGGRRGRSDVPGRLVHAARRGRRARGPSARRARPVHARGGRGAHGPAVHRRRERASCSGCPSRSSRPARRCARSGS